MAIKKGITIHLKEVVKSTKKILLIEEWTINILIQLIILIIILIILLN